MPTHKGQIAFPGGKAEDDDKNLIATALREASEEVALRPESVVVVGQMGQVVLSRQGFVVTPIVGVGPAGIVSELIPNLGELDRMFTVPLKFLIDGPRVMDALPLAKGVNQVPSFYSS